MYEKLFANLLQREASSHKYDYGHVLVIGGSAGMVGAPFLAAMAALRIGAGLVTIGSAREVINKLEKRVVEIMTLRLRPGSPDQLMEFIASRKVNSVVYGPGLKPSGKWLPSLIKQLSLSLVVDGGGLAELQSEPELLNIKRQVPLILTPHRGEFQRFFNKPLPQEPPALIDLAGQFASRHQLILVLKGHPTRTFSQTGEMRTNTSGGPALATAGAGDVLSGLIGGLLAQKFNPFEAAAAAVYLHGLCGDQAASLKTEAAVIASDLIEQLPLVLKTKV